MVKAYSREDFKVFRDSRGREEQCTRSEEKEFFEEVLADYKDYCKQNEVDSIPLKVDKEFLRDSYCIVLENGEFKNKIVVIPEFVGGIEDGTFEDTGVESVEMLDSMVLARGAFEGCNSLKELKYIGDLGSFKKLELWSCFKLRNITISR